MIEGLGKYPAYLDSAIPGVSEVPAHWPVARLKTVFREVDERSRTGYQPLLSLRMQHGLVDHLEAGGKPIPAASLTHYKVTRPGDLVMNRMRAAMGLFGVTPKLGLVSPDYAILQPRQPANLYYFWHLFRTPMMTSVFRLESRGLGTGESGFLRLYTDRFGMLAAPVPPIDEQAAIVKFLDHADRRIRRYIRAKQRLIKLLEEQRQAIIHQAVTCGLDPNVPRKDSGVPWLGQIPAHWEVTRVKNAFSCLNHKRVPLSAVQRGMMTERSYDYYGASGVIDSVESYIFDDDDGLVLLAEDGANLVLRNLPLAIVARGRFWVNNHAHILRPKGGNAQYLAAILEGIDYKPWVTGAAQPKLTMERLLGIQIAIAPAHEQATIMEAANAQVAAITGPVAIARREIDLLKEYRTRLIADVVTGQLDVREAAANLPDLPPDLADTDPDENDDPSDDDPETNPEED